MPDDEGQDANCGADVEVDGREVADIRVPEAVDEAEHERYDHPEREHEGRPSKAVRPARPVMPCTMKVVSASIRIDISCPLPSPWRRRPSWRGMNL